MSVEQQYVHSTYPAHTRNANGPLVLSQMPHHEQRPLLFPEPPPLIFLSDGTVFDPDEDALPPPVQAPVAAALEAPTEALPSDSPAPASQQQTPVVPDTTTATTPPPDLPAYWTPRRVRTAAAVSGALFLLVIVCALLAPWLSPQAIVTISSAQSTLSTSLTVTARPSGVPNPARLQVAARLLSATSPTRTETHATTGTGHQPARAGHGLVMFYNAALTPQLILAGTLLTGMDDVEVVTEQDALLPAAMPPSEGQVTVSAQAVQVGPQGNITVGDLRGPCCRENVFVQNSAFVGGQDARDYPMVTQEDISGLATPLVALLTHSTQTRLQGQVYPTERVIQPVACAPTVAPDHPANSEAAQVSVTVVVACRAETYDAQAVERLALRKLSQQATTLGAGYALHGKLSTSVTHGATSPSGLITLVVQAHGTWSYQISTADLHRLGERIAGKTIAQARRLIAQQESGQVGSIEIGFTGWWSDGTTLPNDPARIHLLVVMLP